MKSNNEKGNIAYIDAQNLRMVTKQAEDPWEVDIFKLRKYLLHKYNVKVAYYFIGVRMKGLEDVYTMIEDAGYTIIFREHSERAISFKKGNVDVDIAFQMLVDVYENNCEKVVLISNDGDYFKVINHLLTMGRLEKVLLPSKHTASSLYKRITNNYYGYLDQSGLKERLKR